MRPGGKSPGRRPVRPALAGGPNTARDRRLPRPATRRHPAPNPRLRPGDRLALRPESHPTTRPRTTLPRRGRHRETVRRTGPARLPLGGAGRQGELSRPPRLTDPAAPHPRAHPLRPRHRDHAGIREDPAHRHRRSAARQTPTAVARNRRRTPQSRHLGTREPRSRDRLRQRRRGHAGQIPDPRRAPHGHRMVRPATRLVQDRQTRQRPDVARDR